MGGGTLHGAFEGTQGNKQYKEKISVRKGKGKKPKDDAPSWAKSERPYVGESGKDFAKRLLDKKYGVGNYKKGQKTEYSKIQKWADVHFK